MEGGKTKKIRVQLKNLYVTLYAYSERINDEGFFVVVQNLQDFYSIRHGSLLNATIHYKKWKNFTLLTRVSQIREIQRNEFMLFLRFIQIGKKEKIILRTLNRNRKDVLSRNINMLPQSSRGTNELWLQKKNLYSNVLKFNRINQLIELISKYKTREWNKFDFDTLQELIRYLSKWDKKISQLSNGYGDELSKLILFFFKISYYNKVGNSYSDYNSLYLLNNNNINSSITLRKYQLLINKIKKDVKEKSRKLHNKIGEELEYELNRCSKIINDRINNRATKKALVSKSKIYSKIQKDFTRPSLYTILVSFLFFIFSFGLSIKQDNLYRARVKLLDINHILPFNDIHLTNRVHFLKIKDKDWNLLIASEKKFKIGNLIRILNKKGVRNFIIIDENDDYKFRYSEMTDKIAGTKSTIIFY